jgi:hypothetical protein
MVGVDMPASCNAECNAPPLELLYVLTFPRDYRCNVIQHYQHKAWFLVPRA